MRRPRIWLFLLAAMIVAGSAWFYVRPEPSVAELRLVQPTSSDRSFYLTNCSSSEVLFRLLTIETRAGDGWSVYTNIAPIAGRVDPFVSSTTQTVGPHSVWYATVTPPPTELPWRLRVEVSRKREGVAKLLAWKRVRDQGIAPIGPFSLGSFQSFRSYGKVSELVSSEIQ